MECPNCKKECNKETCEHCQKQIRKDVVVKVNPIKIPLKGNN